MASFNCSPAQFVPSCMEPVDPETLEKITSSGDALAQERQQALAAMMQPGLQAAIDNPRDGPDLYVETKSPRSAKLLKS